MLIFKTRTLRSFVEKRIPKPVFVLHIDCLVIAHKILDALEEFSLHEIEFALAICFELEVDGS